MSRCVCHTGHITITTHTTMIVSASTTTDMIVADPLSGIAIFGFDPVAYFVEGRARAGERGHEAIWSGVAWRFCSEANRIAFLRNPDVFAPAFGGYDAE